MHPARLSDISVGRAAGSNKPKPSAAVVSIPTFALDKVMLPDCKSQDELEAKLAKYVGLGLPQVGAKDPPERTMRLCTEM